MAVTSVAGRTGDVTLTAADIGAGTFPGDVVLTSTSTGTTQTAGNSTTRLATTAFVTTADNLKANLASPTFTGTVTVPNGAAATDAAAFGQIPTAGGVGGFAKIVIRTGNSSTINTNNTLASNPDDTLLWAVGASDRWFFKAFLTFIAADASGTATTEDIQVGWSVPTGGAMQWGTIGQQGNTFAGFGYTQTTNSPSAILTAASALAGGAAAVTFGAALAGFYTGDGSHAGNVNLLWAQNTSNAATLQIATNSMLQLWRLA